MPKNWYDFPIVVPFGNPNYGAPGKGGPHNMDIGAPPNHPVTAIRSGTVSDLSAPAHGKQVGIKLDSPYNGVPYMAYLHLSAINPSLQMNAPVKVGDVIGWTGGANDPSQYAGTTNPTGENFLNDKSKSSQIQVGIALMKGPVYGQGEGWTTFPPVDWSLNPTQLLLDARGKAKPGPKPVPGPTGIDRTYTREDWARAFLAGLGNKRPSQNVVNWTINWTAQEISGPGREPHFNLLATTHKEPGAVGDFNTVGVQNFDTFAHGVSANVHVLNLGRYPTLLQALSRNDEKLLGFGGTVDSRIQGELRTWSGGGYNGDWFAKNPPTSDRLAQEFKGLGPDRPPVDVPPPVKPPVKTPVPTPSPSPDGASPFAFEAQFFGYDVSISGKIAIKGRK